MDLDGVIAALTALSHKGRLTVFRLLIKAGKCGLSAGAIARETEFVPQTLSGYLNSLVQSGLAFSRRESRSIIYTVNFDRMADMLSYLLEDCCDGRPEICRPLLDSFSNITGCSKPASCQ